MRITKNVKLPYISVENYVKGSGNDETENLQLAFNAASGKTLMIPAGMEIKISSTVTIGDNTTVIAYGAKIYNTENHFEMLYLGSGVRIFGLELEGAGNSSANINGKAIVVTGADSANYLANITLEDCNIHDFGFHGVYFAFVKHVKIIGNKISNIGYAGIATLSCANMKIDKNHIKGISPGSGGNAYNIIITRDSVSSDLHAYPRSKDCVISDNLIEDNTIWEGLDTHSGENIIFHGNTVRNCKVGIAITHSAESIAALNCKVINNNIYGTKTGPGIVVSGYGVVLGTPIQNAENIIINGNNVYECGVQSNQNTGGISLTWTANCIVVTNVVVNCLPHGINLYHNNLGFVVNNNTVVDPNSDTVPSACIITRSDYNTGIISGNSLLRVSPALNTYVASVGVRVTTSTGVSITLGDNFITATTPLSGIA